MEAVTVPMNDLARHVQRAFSHAPFTTVLSILLMVAITVIYAIEAAHG